jgi:hypothetical protein
LVGILSSTSRSILDGSRPSQPCVYTPSGMSKGVSLQSIAIYRAGHYWEDPQVIHLDDGVAGKHLLIEEYGIFLGDYLPLPALL